MHAGHADEFTVAGRVSTQAHQRVGAGIAQHIHQRAQLLRGIAQQHAAAGVDAGPFGRQQQLQRLADLARVAFAHRVVRAHFDALRIASVGRLVEGNVLRDIDHDRAGAAGTGNMKSLLHGFSHVAHVLDQEIVLDDGARDADGVTFLEGIHANRRGRHLSADDHHRDAVHVGGGDAGHGVRQAGAGRHQRDAYIAGGAGIAIGSVDGGLLVAHQHMLNGVLLIKSVINMQHCAAGITPDVLDTFGLKRLDEDFSAPEFLRVGGG